MRQITKNSKHRNLFEHGLHGFHGLAQRSATKETLATALGRRTLATIGTQEGTQEIRRNLFEHGLHGFHGFFMRSHPTNPYNP